MNKKKIVVIGGGNGTQAELKGLAKNKNIDLSVIVSMFDSGGSTGKLRKDLNIPAVGDIRRCFTALRGEDIEILKDLFDVRFDAGDLKGHNLGNLILAGLLKTSKSPEEAWQKASKLFNVVGNIYPSSMDNSNIVAEFENGRIVEGETNIDVIENDNNRNPDLRIINFYSKPQATAFPPAMDAIMKADLIVIGPGDIYTSILANFTAKGLPEAIQKTNAKKIYVCNVLTKPGETGGMTVSGHIKEVLKYTGLAKLDYVIANNRPVDDGFIKSNTEVKNQEIVVVDEEEARKLCDKLILADVINEKEPANHDSEKLVSAILSVME